MKQPGIPNDDKSNASICSATFHVNISALGR